MASSRLINCLDLGTQTVALAQFSGSGNGGLSLETFQTAELLADPAAEASRIPQLRLALKDLASQTGLKNTPAIYALPGQAIFSRFVMLPTVEQSRVEQIIGFEAQQNVPFPLTEVVWDYQLIARTASETELALIAIRKELLHDVNEAVEDAGFVTNIVDVAPMALFNAFRFNYPEISDCSLIIDIGARTTNLIFVEQGLLFVRVVMQGGNSVTSAIAKEFDESFQEAEERKIRDGFVNLGGAYEDPADPQVATLSKVIRNATTKLHAEISRNIGYYRANLKGEKPRQVFLAGGGTSLPFTREFFSEKFGLPVEYFNPLKNVTVSPKLAGNAALARPHLLGEVVGLALRAQGATPSEINLRPASVQQRQELSSRKPFFMLASACVLLAALAFYLHQLKANEVANNALADLKPKVDNLKTFEGRIKAAQERIKAEEATAAPLTEVTAEREYWTALLDDLNKALPDRNIWITVLEPMTQGNVLPPQDAKKFDDAAAGRLQPPKGNTPAPAAGAGANANKKSPAAAPPTVPSIDAIVVQGLVINDPGVVQTFVNNLKNSEFVDVNAENAFTVVKISPTANDAEWAFEYRLELPLKRKLPLK